MPKFSRYTTIDASAVPPLLDANVVSDESMVEIINEIRSGKPSNIALAYYVLGVIERGNFAEAIRFTAQLIADKRPESAAILAESLYDVDAPLANDAKWVEQMLVVANSTAIYLVEATGDNLHENQCGEWIPGHRPPEKYQAMLEECFDVVVPLPLICHGYLKKQAKFWAYTDEPEPGTVPITTCLDPRALAELASQYP